MNFRCRDLLDLAYEMDCTLRIPGVCEGGRGEPCHANEQMWGKGGAMKAHDFAIASGCRACHRWLDQSKNDIGQKRYYWLRGHVETMYYLWSHEYIVVANPLSRNRLKAPLRAKVKPKSKGNTARPSKVLPREGFV